MERKRYVPVLVVPVANNSTQHLPLHHFETDNQRDLSFRTRMMMVALTTQCRVDIRDRQANFSSDEIVETFTPQDI